MIRFSSFAMGDAVALFAADGLDAEAAAIERAGRHGRAAWTLVADGRPRAIGGVIDLHAGVADLWCFRACDITRGEALAFARFCKRFVASDPTRRLQATARADDPVALDFLFFLGLEPEGVLRSYDPGGADHVQYARVRRADGGA